MKLHIHNFDHIPSFIAGMRPNVLWFSHKIALFLKGAVTCFLVLVGKGVVQCLGSEGFSVSGPSP